jgi:hypothetical protein
MKTLLFLAIVAIVYCLISMYQFWVKQRYEYIYAPGALLGTALSVLGTVFGLIYLCIKYFP